MTSRLQISGLVATLACVGMSASLAVGGPFRPNGLVVLRVGTNFPSGGGAIVLEEYTRAGASVGNVLELPTAGADALCQADLSNHDRHLHRSVNGQYLSFTAYNTPPSSSDPRAFLSNSVPRVVGLVKYDGTVDLSTRLTNTCDFTGIRSAMSTDGASFWIGGDNASGANTTGGTRFTTRGSASSVNISRTQNLSSGSTPDNIRDAVIAAGQLYVCSGSDASVGKGVHICGSGLPTSGVQPLVGPINGPGTSVSGFILFDLNPSVPGLDVMYVAATANAGVIKYVKDGSGSWANRGSFPLQGVEDVIGAVQNGSVVLFAAAPTGVLTFTDTAPVTGVLDATAGSGAFIITPPAGFSLGGLDFTPTCFADFNKDGHTTVQDIFDFLSAWFAMLPSADANGSGGVTTQDIFDFLSAWFAGC